MINNSKGVAISVTPLLFASWFNIDGRVYIDDNYKSFLLQNYEDTYYPEKMINAWKAAYVERNYEMINNSNFCICYYDENYTPQRRKNNRGDLIDFQQKSGTKLAYSYAKRKNIVVKNTFYLSFNNQI